MPLSRLQWATRSAKLRIMEILPQLVVFSMITGTFYSVAAIGMYACSTYGRYFNMAVGPLCMTGAYTALALSNYAQLHPVLAVPAFIIAAFLIGWILDTFFASPFRNARGMASFVSTLSFAIMLEAIVSLTFGVSVQSYSFLSSAHESLQIGAVYLTRFQILVILTGLSIAAFVLSSLRWTSFGRVLRALSSNPAAFSSLGFNERRVNLAISCGATLFFFLCGFALAADTNLSPTMGSYLTIKAFAAVVLGGQWGMGGVIIASYALGFIENFAVGLTWGGISISAGYKDAVAYLCVLCAMLVLHRRYVMRQV